MILSSRAALKTQKYEAPWVVVVIGVLSACTAGLFIANPSLLTLGLFASLLVGTFLEPSFSVYVSIFLLPWHPLVDVNLPIRDVSLILHFVLFVGIWLRLRAEERSIRDWLVGSTSKKLIFVFAGIAGLSFLRSGLPGGFESSRALVLLASYMALFFAMDGWLESRAQIVLVLKVLLISTIGVSLFGFYQAIEGGYTDLFFRLYPLEEEALDPWSGRITSLVPGYNSLAGYLNLVIPIAIACAVLAKERRLKLLGIICAIFGALALLLTQSRGGLLALTAILVAAVWFLVPRLIIRIRLLSAGVLGCMLLLPLLTSQFTRLQDVLDDPEALSRIYLWAAAVTLFLAHPFLGAGYGNYRFLYSDLSFVPNAIEGRLDAHNVYLQLLAETGISGFLCFLVVVGSFLFPAAKAIREEDPILRIVAFGVIGAITGMLVHGMVDFLFRVSPQFGALFWVILGLGSRVMGGNSSDNNPRPLTT